MKPGAHIMISATARLYAPLIVLFAISLLAGAPSGSGVGFVAGLAVGLALLLHALVFGATASARAFPPWVSRVFVALGLVAASVGAGVPGLAFAPRIVEAGAFLLTLGACTLVIVALFGRAPILRDGEW